MNCSEIQEEIYAYLDRELDDTLRAEIDGHLNDCSSCHEFYQDSAEFEKELKILSELPEQEPPENGWEKFSSRLIEQEDLEIELPEYSIFEKIQLSLKRNLPYIGLAGAACLAILLFSDSPNQARPEHSIAGRPANIETQVKPELAENIPIESGELPIEVKLDDSDMSIFNPISASLGKAVPGEQLLKDPSSSTTVLVEDEYNLPIPMQISESDLNALVSIQPGTWISSSGVSKEVGPFLMDRFPVTNREYLLFVKDRGQRPPFHWNGSSFSSVDDSGLKPVTYVSWEDANSYCQWKGMSLPTNSQWEWAAGGGSSSRYPWGNEYSSNFANTRESGQGIVPIGTYPKNVSSFGVYDMVGNIREWVLDAPEPRKEAIPGLGKNLRLMKGGSYLDPADRSTISYSFEGLKDEIYGNAGIRCVSIAGTIR